MPPIKSFSSAWWCFCATVIASLFMFMHVEAAYRPGWTPPSCLGDSFRPTNVSIEVDTTFPGFMDPTETIYYATGVPVTRFHVHNRTTGKMEPFFPRGVGYSPIWPSKYTYSTPFDLFTSEYEYIWRRDLERIRSMGANTIRVWSWDSFRDHSAFLDACYEKGLYLMVPFFFDPSDYPVISTPFVRQEILTDFRAFVLSVMSHPAVLAYLIGNELNSNYGAQRDELFSLVNQMVRIRDEVDPARHPLSLPLSDVAFVESYSNPYFQWSAVDFWSLQTYREPAFLHLPIQDYFYSYIVNMSTMGLPFKPLVMTEFGVDSLPPVTTGGSWPQDGSYPAQPAENQTKQASMLCEMFTAMRVNVAFDLSLYLDDYNYATQGMSAAGVVGGAIIMEWNDEWWKGTFPDVRAPMCPNKRTELHTWCAHDVGVATNPYYLHEEWLGLTSQIYDEDQRSFCLVPRKSYFSMTRAFFCNGNESCLGFGTSNDGFGCRAGISEMEVPTDQWCADRHNVFLNPYISMLAPGIIIFGALMGWAFYLKRKREKDLQALNDERRMSRGSLHEGEAMDGTYQSEESPTSSRGKRLRESIAAAFLQFCNVGTVDNYHTANPHTTFCPYFKAYQDRLFVQIWDKYLGFHAISDNNLTTAIRIVYEQTMEAYYLWTGQRAYVPNETPLLDREAMLSHMALYGIVQSWAGTVNHCPEKICEVFEFSKQFFAHCVPSSQGASRIEQIQDFHHGLVEIFRVYYLKVDEGEHNFEDINMDAIHFRNARLAAGGDERKESFWKSVSVEKDQHAESYDAPRQLDPATAANLTSKSCLELDLLPRPEIAVDLSKQRHPYLEYHKQRNPETTLLSDAGQMFFKCHKALTGRIWLDNSDAFPQKGGPLTLLFNYGYIIRYLLWQNLWATYLQPITISQPICLCTYTQYLAVIDAAWMLLSAALHARVLGRLTRRIIIEGVFYGLCLCGVGASMLVLHTDVDGSNTSMSNAFGMGWTIPTMYVAVAAFIAMVEELSLIIRTSVPTYPIRGRFTDTGAVVRTRVGFFVSLLLIAAPLGFMWLPGITSQGSMMAMLNTSVIVPFFPSLMTVVWWLMFMVGTTVAPWQVAKRIASTSVDKLRKARSRKIGKHEADYLVLNYIYWALFSGLNWCLAYYILVPAINNITFDICRCDANILNLNEAESAQCKNKFAFTCYIAVVFTWLSAELISFVALYSIFEMLLLIFGLFRGKANRVGNVKTWQDVQQNFEGIRARCMRRVSSCLLFEEKQAALWNCFAQALFEDCLLNDKELADLTITASKKQPDFSRKPRSAEAIRRIIYYLWSLESSMAHEEVGGSSVHSSARRAHRVTTMPTWTTVIPAYNETIIFEEHQLTKARTQGSSHMRITEMEYLVHTYPDEWDNFAERMKKIDATWVVNADNYSIDLLQSFLGTPGHPPLSEALRFEARWWATMRGQTLARTVQGMLNWRTAMLHLLKLEEEGISDDEAQRIMLRKCQIVVAHQTYNPNNDVTKKLDCPHEEAMEICFRRLKFFDLVYNDDDNFQSVCKRVKPDILVAESRVDLKFEQTIQIADPKGGKPGAPAFVERKLFNYFPKDAFELTAVQRVGKLKIGEGKAENQMGALHFVNGMVLQAIDMNQYATTENGFKLPYILTDYFQTPYRISATDGTWDGDSLIPQYRILGFPEWCFTRSLSLVGELMGAAEWCFVTITHRVLDWPLRIRAHYGHPDFFDSFWVRNRGGQSKASPLVNTNEDIFAGYEMIGRGDRGAFVEFIEAQKGRETSFGGAFTFEAKLAQGGAQQCRSFDVYRLNRGLDYFTRNNLFYSSLAFYVTNLLMAISINYYILAIALYAVSGVTYHKLGLLDAVIAIPWLVQIGYVLALPYLMELSIQRGFWQAIGTFIRTLPPAIVFFIFHLRTKAYFFTQGLLIGKGGYAGTGRGFGLDRANFVTMYKSYSESHYHEGLLIGLALVVYAVYGNDPAGPYLLRCWNIILIVISWMWAPILFNPAPTTQDLHHDLKDMLDWSTNAKRPGTDLELMTNKLKRVHFLRLAGLVDNLIKECRAHLDQSGAELHTAAILDSNAGSSSARQARPHTLSASKLEPHNDDSSHTVPASLDMLSNFRGVTQQLVSRSNDVSGGATDLYPHGDDASGEGLTKALKIVYEVLCGSQDRIQREIKRITGCDDAKSSMTLNGIIAEHWGSAENDSWEGWYQKAVVVMSWEGEDQFFPGLLNLVVQKVYIHLESYLPWIVLCIDQFSVDSVWFLVLIVIAVAADVLVERGFREHHEYTTLARGFLLLTIPFALLYFHYSIMSVGQLIWSLLLFGIAVLLFVKTFYGVVNARAKGRLFGIYGNPYHMAFDAFEAKTDNDKDRIQASVKNRTQEMEATNQNEERRFLLFKERLRHLNYVTLFRSILPLITVAFLTVGNAITVVLGEWITTLNFNGRVNEAWKKAYLRPSISIVVEASSPPPPPPGPAGHKVTLPPTAAKGEPDAFESINAGVSTRSVASRNASEPLTRDAQKQEDDALSTQAAVYGTISSSLAPSAAKRAHRSRNFVSGRALGLGGTAAMPILGGPASSRTLLSAGSYTSHFDEEAGAGERLLTQGGEGGYGAMSPRQSSLSSVQPRHAMQFLNKYATKEMEKQGRK